MHMCQYVDTCTWVLVPLKATRGELEHLEMEFQGLRTSSARVAGTLNH